MPTPVIVIAVIAVVAVAAGVVIKKRKKVKLEQAEEKERIAMKQMLAYTSFSHGLSLMQLLSDSLRCKRESS